MAQEPKLWPRQAWTIGAQVAANFTVKPFDVIKSNALAIGRFMVLEAIGQPNVAKAAFGVVVFCVLGHLWKFHAIKTSSSDKISASFGTPAVFNDWMYSEKVSGGCL